MKLLKTVKYEIVERKLCNCMDLQLDDLKKALKIVFYMVSLNAKNKLQKYELIKNTFNKHYMLDDIFEDEDIMEYIFSLVLGAEKNDIRTISFRDMQFFCLSFVESVRDVDLKYMLMELLEAIETHENTSLIDELNFITIYAELLNSEFQASYYKDILKNIPSDNSYVTKFGIIATDSVKFNVIPFSMIYDVVYNKDSIYLYYKGNTEIGSFKNQELQIAKALLQIVDINKKLDTKKRKTIRMVS